MYGLQNLRLRARTLTHEKRDQCVLGFNWSLSDLKSVSKCVLRIGFTYPCWTNVEDVGLTLYKCYANVLCLLDSIPIRHYFSQVA